MKIVGDRYSKYQEVENIVNIINTCVEEKKPVSFSIEGSWGKGKTWIIGKVEAKLKNLDLTKEYTPEQIKKAPSNYLIINYNAWERDYCDEPLIAILLTIVNQINENLWKYNVFNVAIKETIETSVLLLEGLLGSLSKKVIGIDVINIGKQAFKKVSNIKKSSEIKISNTAGIDNIETDVALVVKTLTDISKVIPIVFVVDELDRCTPSMAIKTLERLHHIFGKVDRSVTIISIYREQIEESIKVMFGNKITPNEYLRKFINFKVVLMDGDVDDIEMNRKIETLSLLFADSKVSQKKSTIVKEICANMSARDFENLCNTAILCHKFVGEKTKDLPHICVEAELLLLAYKLASEREGLEGNIAPNVGNRPQTPLGEYIKATLKDVCDNNKTRDSNMWDSKYSNTFNANDDKTIILLVFNVVKDFTVNWIVRAEDQELFDRLKNYYSEYKKYYTLLR